VERQRIAVSESLPHAARIVAALGALHFHHLRPEVGEDRAA